MPWFMWLAIGFVLGCLFVFGLSLMWAASQDRSREDRDG